jgi:hypothetical protein
MEAARRADRPSPLEWADLTDFLDDALARIPPDDRRLIVLRYLEDRSAEDAAGMLGLTAVAVRQRTRRSLERLRTRLVTAGCGAPAMTAGALGHALTTRTVLHAPRGLSTTILASPAGAIPPPAAGAAAWKGALLMSWTKSYAAAVAMVVTLGVSLGTAVYVARAQQPAPPAPPAPTKLAPAAPAKRPAWRDKFDATYALADGEALKRIPPPFIAERRRFLDGVPAIGGLPWDQTLLVIEWDPEPHWIALGGSRGSPAWAVQAAIRLKGYQFNDWGAPEMALKLPGDWSVRKSASAADQLAALAKVMRDELKLNVRFEQRRVPHDVYVVRGAYAHHPLEDAPPPAAGADRDVIELLPGKRLPDREVIAGPVTLGEMLRQLDELLTAPVIDETGPDTAKLPVTVRHHEQGSVHGPERDQLLRNLARQTSLEFLKDQRELDVWFLVRDK